MKQATILAALDLSSEGLASEFAAKLHFLSHPKGLLLSGDMTAAAVTVGRETKGTTSKPTLVAALAFGWIVPVGPSDGRVRMFRITKVATECIDFTAPKVIAQCSEKTRSRYRYARTPLPLEAAVTRKQDLITDTHLIAAKQYQAIYAGRDSAMADVYQIVCQCLPPRLVTVLDEVCGRSTGFEALEQMMRLPARSGKALVAAALETLTHTRTTS